MKFILSLSLKVKIIIAVCAVAAAAAVGAAIVINSEDAYRVIKVFELNGSAAVTRENTGDIDAYEGMNLESGDILSVEENSTLRISLDSDKYILLDGGTVLKLIAQGTAADSKTVIELQTGTILNEIKNSLSANSSYEVNTPKATMAVRGTVFSVTTLENPDGSFVTDLYTAEGKVSVQLFDENGEPKGTEIYVPKGGAVTILTEVNGETYNHAAVDGDPHFVFRNGKDGLDDCGDRDPVYYPDSNVSAEAQTEQTVASVPSITSITETGETNSETSVTSTAAEMAASKHTYVTNRSPVSLAEETVTEKRKLNSVTAFSERTTTTDFSETTAPITTTVPAPTASYPVTRVTTVPVITTTVPTETAAATVPTATSKLTETASATTEPEITTTKPATTTTEPTTTTTEPATTTTEPATTTTEPATTTTEPTTTTTEPPTVYRVSFIDENGTVLSQAEFEENETLGTIPRITDKKGYTAKWICGGAEVTSDTVISADMEITAEYTPKPVTVQIYSPYPTKGDQYYAVKSFTVMYGEMLADNEEGHTIDSLKEFVEGQYEPNDYYDDPNSQYYKKLNSITFSSGSAAGDSYLIADECVYDDNGTLYANVYFNYGSNDDT